MSTDRVAAIRAIIFFGLVSLLGDVIYEGVRGTVPSYLEYLGASAFIVGVGFGIGEFVGYALRLVSGIIADTTQAYWRLYILGYGLLVILPMLGLFNWWIIVVIFIIIERSAKALRAPARDTLISVASKDLGTGKAFGLHELMDQIGAIIGPGIISLTLFISDNSYFHAYSLLFIPYIILMMCILYTYRTVTVLKRPVSKVINPSEKKTGSIKFLALPNEFKIYTISVILNTMGLIHITLILYAISKIIIAYIVGTIYLFVQVVDAVAAAIFGNLYDKYGRKLLIVPFAISTIPSILALTRSSQLLIIAALLFGIIYGMQESIYRAAVSDIVPINIRGTAYGVFNAVYGLGFLLSGSIFGWIIENDIFILGVSYAVITQLLAIFILLKSINIT